MSNAYRPMSNLRRWRRWRYYPIMLVTYCVFCLASSFSTANIESSSNTDVSLVKDVGASSRHLLSLQSNDDNLTNCVPAAIGNFPSDLFTNNERRQGAIALHILTALYMFLGLAIVCDDFFVPCLECICQALNLEPNVAGATFMAAGSSAPELATTVLGVFVAKDDIGLGSVVGSADYNLMFVIAVCALFAHSVVHLNWYPLVRDCFYYSLTVLVLALVIMDGKVHWYESLCLLLLYLVYVAFMYFNRPMETYFIDKCAHFLPQPPNSPNNKYLLHDNDADTDLELAVPLTTTVNGSCHLEEIVLEDVPRNGSYGGLTAEVNANADTFETALTATSDAGKAGGEKIERQQYIISWPTDSSLFLQVLHAVGLPLKILLFLTVPDCRLRRFKRLFWLTFVMSCLWISVYSYIMVWMITIIGHTAKVPDSVMGLTFVAAGSSVPDAIASVIVVREGEGDMAVSNAVGSNIFDILICMGLPWLLKSCFYQKVIKVYSRGLLYSTMSLFATVILLLVATHLNGWKLSRGYGCFLFVIYALFLVLCSLYELNILGIVHPPTCVFND